MLRPIAAPSLAQAFCAAFFTTVLSLGGFRAEAQLPDPALTPGAVNPAVAQDTIASTICARGWTRTIRPSQSYTQALKRQGIAAYGYADKDPRDYQEDHLIPLELGGDYRATYRGSPWAASTPVLFQACGTSRGRKAQVPGPPTVT